MASPADPRLTRDYFKLSMADRKAALRHYEETQGRDRSSGIEPSRGPGHDWSFCPRLHDDYWTMESGPRISANRDWDEQKQRGFVVARRSWPVHPRKVNLYWVERPGGRMRAIGEWEAQGAVAVSSSSDPQPVHSTGAAQRVTAVASASVSRSEQPHFQSQSSDQSMLDAAADGGPGEISDGENISPTTTKAHRPLEDPELGMGNIPPTATQAYGPSKGPTAGGENIPLADDQAHGPIEQPDVVMNDVSPTSPQANRPSKDPILDGESIAPSGPQAYGPVEDPDVDMRDISPTSTRAASIGLSKGSSIPKQDGINSLSAALTRSAQVGAELTTFNHQLPQTKDSNQYDYTVQQKLNTLKTWHSTCYSPFKDVLKRLHNTSAPAGSIPVPAQDHIDSLRTALTRSAQVGAELTTFNHKLPQTRDLNQYHQVLQQKLNTFHTWHHKCYSPFSDEMKRPYQTSIPADSMPKQDHIDSLPSALGRSSHFGAELTELNYRLSQTSDADERKDIMRQKLGIYQSWHSSCYSPFKEQMLRLHKSSTPPTTSDFAVAGAAAYNI